MTVGHLETKAPDKGQIATTPSNNIVYFWPLHTHTNDVTLFMSVLNAIGDFRKEMEVIPIQSPFDERDGPFKINRNHCFLW